MNKTYTLFNILYLQPLLVSLASLFGILGHALGLVPYLMVAQTANLIYQVPVQYDAIYKLVLWVLLALFVRYIFLGATNILAHIQAFRILHTLRVEVAKKLGDVPLSFFSKRSTGELKKIMMDDINHIENFVAHNFPDAIAAFVVPLFSTCLLVWIDWRMALISISLAPIAYMVMAYVMRNTDTLHREWNDIHQKMNSALLEYVQGMKVIKTFGISADKFGNLTRTIEAGITWMSDFMKTTGYGYGVFMSLIASSLVIIVPSAGWFYLKGTLSLQHFVLFIVLGPQLTMGMMKLLFAWQNAKKISINLSKINDILNTPNLDNPHNTKAPTKFNIEFKNVSFSYTQDQNKKDSNQVLKNISFEIPENTVTALVGPSGAGKTTLTNLIPRFWEHTDGSISIGGIDIKEIPLDILLSKISFVFQDVFLFYGTVIDNIRLGKSNATEDEIIEACKKAQAHEFIEALPQGYQTLLGERGARLSGGEKQRISIARAILKDTPILILDEATSSSDPVNEAKIQDALAYLCKNKTVIVIAHRLTTISEVNQIIVLEQGKIESMGPHEALLQKSSLYQTLWKNHIGSQEWNIGVHS